MLDLAQVIAQRDEKSPTLERGWMKIVAGTPEILAQGGELRTDLHEIRSQRIPFAQPAANRFEREGQARHAGAEVVMEIASEPPPDPFFRGQQALSSRLRHIIVPSAWAA
jgi:hypothetical protein